MYKMLSILFISLLMIGTVEAATSDLKEKIYVNEEEAIGTTVATFTVTGANSLILEGDITNYLGVKVDSSCTVPATCKKFNLVTVDVIDREKVTNGFVKFTPKFSDGSSGTPRYLIIRDKNDNTPVFQEQRYKATIPENFTVGDIIKDFQIIATDVDENPTLIYSLILAGQNSEGDGPMKFKDPYVGKITVEKKLDYETRNFYEYRVLVNDSVNTAYASVWIQVQDVQDMPPAFTSSSFVEKVNEGSPKGTPITKVTAEDQDRGVPNDIGYEIVTDPCSAFSINITTGEIKVDTDNLDREDPTIDKLSGVCTVEVEAYEIVNNQKGDNITKSITIFIEDINDNDPVFNQNSFTATVNENSQENYPVTINEIITVKDNDTVVYSKFSLSLKTLDDKPFTALKVTPVKSLRETNIALSVNVPAELDYEKETNMTFKIVAEDIESSKTSEATVALKILPMNEFSPKFLKTNYSVNVLEGITVDDLITINATDRDDGKDGDVKYAIFGDDSFTINNKNGTISVSNPLDYEKITSYNLIVEATDGGNKKATANLNVFVEDTNDNSPIFRPKFYTGFLREGEPKFEYEIIVKATDADKENSNNSEVEYSIVNVTQGLSNNFTIDPQKGIITPLNIDRESLTDDTIQLKVKAADKGVTPLEDTAVVNITVLDVNDNGPQFEQSVYNISIKESLAEDSWLLNVTATDDDKTGPFNWVTYRLKSQASIFRINSVDGSIFLSSKLDREKKAFYSFTIDAIDGGSPPKTATTEVNVTVKDVNDEMPILILDNKKIEVYENITVGSFITSINATDKDLDTKLIFNISQQTIEIDGKGKEANDNNNMQYFEIDNTTGNITLKIELDREKFERILLNVEVSDQKTVLKDGTVTGTLTITIMDINDCYPVFQKNSISLNLVENYPNGSIVATLTATDEDKNDFATYKILDNTNTFSINNKTGEISLISELDREENPNITFTVVASDSLLPPLSSTATVFVVVEDFNDNAPEFQNLISSLPVPENTAINSTITTITTTDRDIGIHANISYTLTVPGGNSPFKIDKITGEIILISELDREKVDKYTLIITAKDNYDRQQNFHRPGWRYNTTTTLINVTDVNDNSPEFKSPKYLENFEESVTAEILMNVAADDKDIGENSKVLYSLQEKEPILFKIDQHSGNLGMVSNLINKVGEKCFNVTATDQGNPPLNSTVPICINIIDINNNNPKFETPNDTIHIPESTCSGSNIYHVKISDKDKGVNSKIKYELESNGDQKYFEINEFGNVSLKEQLDFETQSKYKVGIKASDSGNISLPSIPTIFWLFVNVSNINDETPEFYQPNKTLEMTEGPSPTEVGPVKAKDSGFELCYTIDNTDDASFFVLKNDSNAALIMTKKEVDYEERKSLKLVVVVSSCEDIKLNTSCPKDTSHAIINKITVDVVIKDANDNPPMFTEKSFSKAIIYDVSNEEDIFDLAYYVTDADSDPKNKQHAYFIESFEYFGNNALKQLKTPFEIKTNGIYRKADFDSSVSGYIQMTIKVNDTKGLATKTTVKIHILSETNEVNIVFTKPIEEARKQNPAFIKFLQSVIGDKYEIIPGKLDVAKNSQNEIDSLRTNLVLYAVNNETKEVIPAADLMKLLDMQKISNPEQFKDFSVEKVQVPVHPVEDNNEKIVITLTVVIAVLALILIAMAIMFYRSNRRYNRKLRAAKTHAAPQNNEAETAYPGTNLFSDGHINPLYNNLDEKDMVGPLPDKVSLNSNFNNQFGDMSQKGIYDLPEEFNYESQMPEDNSKLDLDNVIKERDAEMNKINNNSMIPDDNSNRDVDVEATEV